VVPQATGLPQTAAPRRRYAVRTLLNASAAASARRLSRACRLFEVLLRDQARVGGDLVVLGAHAAIRLRSMGVDEKRKGMRSGADPRRRMFGASRSFPPARRSAARCARTGNCGWRRSRARASRGGGDARAQPAPASDHQGEREAVTEAIADASRSLGDLARTATDQAAFFMRMARALRDLHGCD